MITASVFSRSSNINLRLSILTVSIYEFFLLTFDQLYGWKFNSFILPKCQFISEFDVIGSREQGGSELYCDRAYHVIMKDIKPEVI